MLRYGLGYALVCIAFLGIGVVSQFPDFQFDLSSGPASSDDYFVMTSAKRNYVRESFVYNTTLYSDWSEWGDCNTKEKCSQIRYRKCLEDNAADIKVGDPDLYCPAKYLIEKRKCEPEELKKCEDKIAAQYEKVDSLKDTCGQKPEDVRMKIFGGEEVPSVGTWPWNIGLYLQSEDGEYEANTPFCEATLIAPEYAVTAAHCIKEYLPDTPRTRRIPRNKWVKIKNLTQSSIKLIGRLNDYSISETDAGETTIDIEEFNLHHKFSKLMTLYDIAILKFKKIESEDAKYLCLPKDEKPLPLASKCFAVGWGKRMSNRPNYLPFDQGLSHDIVRQFLLNPHFTQNFGYFDNFDFRRRIPRRRAYGPPDILHQVEIPLVPLKFCKRYFVGLSEKAHICAGKRGKDTCEGDSGGGLYCKDEELGRWVLYGVTSFGSASGCGRSYGIYASVPSSLKWIRETLANDN